MNVLIVEDEAIAIEWLKAQLLEVDDSITVVGELDSIQNAVEWLRSMPPPDLVFMDIQLADGLSFEIFTQIYIPSPVVFTTSFDEFALQAFKVHSIDYLLKPITKMDLQRSLEKYKRLQEIYTTRAAVGRGDTEREQIESPPPPMEEERQDSNANITRLVEQLLQAQPARNSSRLLVQQGNKMLPLGYDDIAFISSENKLTYITTHDDKRYIKNRSLDELEAFLPRETFFRINRQFIVHIGAVSSILLQQSGKLKVYLKPLPAINKEEGRDTFVSRERFSDFKSWLGK
jgi:DNA-binding LytR/AlgR family response regulator